VKPSQTAVGKLRQPGRFSTNVADGRQDVHLSTGCSEAGLWGDPVSNGLFGSLTPAQRRFLLLDNGVGPFIANLLINGVIAWLLFRNATHVPLWGQSSIAGDTIATSFLLPAITCLIVTPLARGRVRSGRLPAAVDPAWRWIPRNMGWRAILIGLVGLLALTPLTLLLFGTLGIGELRPWQFISFKATFAAIEGALVTPFLALWAISEMPAGAIGAVEPAIGT
jgi:hypothetical protein